MLKFGVIHALKRTAVNSVSVRSVIKTTFALRMPTKLWMASRSFARSVFRNSKKSREQQTQKKLMME